MHPHTDLTHAVTMIRLNDLRREAEQVRLLNSISACQQPVTMKVRLPLTRWTLNICLTRLAH